KARNCPNEKRSTLCSIILSMSAYPSIMFSSANRSNGSRGSPRRELINEKFSCTPRSDASIASRSRIVPLRSSCGKNPGPLLTGNAPDTSSDMLYRALQFPHVSRARREGQLRGGLAWRDKLARLVLQRCHGKAQTLGEAVLDIADRGFTNLDARSNALVAGRQHGCGRPGDDFAAAEPTRPPRRPCGGAMAGRARGSAAGGQA